MKPSRARVARQPLAPMPIKAESDFVSAVERISAVMAGEAARLATKQALGNPLNEVDTRVLANLALAAKALQSGSLWGARAIKAKSGDDK